MDISRRNFVSMLSAMALSSALTGRAQAVPERDGPILWSVNHNGAKTYIFGFGDAKDRSWLSSKVKEAFEESKVIWFETPNGPVSDRDKAEDDELVKKLGHDDKRTLFDVLGPRIGPRTLKLTQELGVARSEVEHLRPWLAYFVINSAFWRQNHIEIGDYPDQVLAEMALTAKKQIRAEFPKGQDTTRWFAALSDETQREHMEDLLDYIDDENAGRHKNNEKGLGWLGGNPDTTTIDRMRSKRPAMYEEFHARRNRQWAARIATFDSADSPYFVVIGLNHVLGPDSLLRCLERIGIGVRKV